MSAERDTPTGMGTHVTAGSWSQERQLSESEFSLADVAEILQQATNKDHIPYLQPLYLASKPS